MRRAAGLRAASSLALQGEQDGLPMPWDTGPKACLDRRVPRGQGQLKAYLNTHPYWQSFALQTESCTRLYLRSQIREQFSAQMLLMLVWRGELMVPVLELPFSALQTMSAHSLCFLNFNSCELNPVGII